MRLTSIFYLQVIITIKMINESSHDICAVLSWQRNHGYNFHFVRNWNQIVQPTTSNVKSFCCAVYICFLTESTVYFVVHVCGCRWHVASGKLGSSSNDNWHHLKVRGRISELHIDGLVQERRNSIANALELRLSCTNPSTYKIQTIPLDPKSWGRISELQIDGLVQERRNSITNALELRLSCTNPSIYSI